MILLITVVVLVSIVYFGWRRVTFWSRQGIKGPNLFQYLRRFCIPYQDFCLEMSAKYGRVFSGFSLLNKHIFINDPELIGLILSKYFDKFPGHVNWNLGPSLVANKILFFVPGNEDWKRIHSILSPAFTSAKLKAMFPQMSSICDQFIERLAIFERKGQVVDIRKYIGGLTMDIIASCAYGIKTEAINNPDHPFIINSEKISQSLMGPKMVFCALLPNLAELFKINLVDEKAIDYFTELTKHLIKEREIRSIEGKKSNDFIQTMTDYYELNLAKNNPNSSPAAYLTFEEIAAQVAFLIAAGHETSADVFCHIVYYMCKYKDYQQKLYEELQEVEDFSYENLTQLKWLNAIINETLRMAPSLLFVSRVCIENIEISGIKIPSGTTVEIMPYSVHRDPKYWTEPNCFRPERFFKPTHNQWAFIPFGGGPRICLGRNFGLSEIKICVAKLFLMFEIDFAPDFKLNYHKGHLFLTQKDMNVIFKTRK